jgi:hypothetical protein
MVTSIVEFGMGLPKEWHVLPVGDDGREWAESMATDLMPGAEPFEGARSLVVQQLVDVRTSVASVGTAGIQTAVLIEAATAPVITAMLTANVAVGTTPEAYEADLGLVARDVEDAQVMGNQLFRGEVPAGDVLGAHVLIGHMPDDPDEAGAHLEERVHAAIFPPGSVDAVDLMVIAANVGIFEDLPTTAVDLLSTVTLRTEDAA